MTSSSTQILAQFQSRPRPRCQSVKAKNNDKEENKKREREFKYYRIFSCNLSFHRMTLCHDPNRECDTLQLCRKLITSEQLEREVSARMVERTSERERIRNHIKINQQQYTHTHNARQRENNMEFCIYGNIMFMSFSICIAYRLIDFLERSSTQQRKLTIFWRKYSMPTSAYFQTYSHFDVEK